MIQALGDWLTPGKDATPMRAVMVDDHRLQSFSSATMAPQENQRPAWLNWLFLLIFLWSSWQLAGFWLVRLSG